MANKTDVLDSVENSINELDFLKIEVEDLRVDEDGRIDTTIILKYIEDVRDSINLIQNNFEEYHEEVSDIEDDIEGLVKRLSEVIN